MTDRTLEETETALYQNAADRHKWHMGTEDDVMIRKMARLGILPSKINNGWHEYELTDAQVVIRRGKAQYSEETLATKRALIARVSPKRIDTIESAETQLPD